MQSHIKTPKDLVDLCSEFLTSESEKVELFKIVDKCYEIVPHPIVTSDKTTKYGMKFPIHSETLFDIMIEAKGKIVLELAGASGENSLLIGLSGAKDVYVNDLVSDQLAIFKKNVLKFDRKDVFHVIEGDCFKVFQDEKFTGMFDIIYARNFYHFFLGEQKRQLHKLFDRLLKPAGKLILTTNSSKRLPFESCFSHQQLLSNPDSYVFSTRRPILRGRDGNDRITEAETFPLLPNKCESINPLEYKFKPLLSFADNKILVTYDFASFSDANQRAIMDFAISLQKTNGIYIKDNKMKRIDLKLDYFEYHECHMVAYSARTLIKQFAQTNFIIIKTISTDAIGHICESDLEESSITIVCMKKNT